MSELRDAFSSFAACDFQAANDSDEAYIQEELNVKRLLCDLLQVIFRNILHWNSMFRSITSNDILWKKFCLIGENSLL